MKKNVNAPIAKESANLNQINLDKFADQLSKIELKEKKDKETIYIYPESFSKSDIGDAKGKKYRNKLRNELKKLSNNILLFAKMKRIDDLQNEIAKFDAFYSANYRLQDYSIASISQSNNPEKEKDFELFLSIIKSIKSAN